MRALVLGVLGLAMGLRGVEPYLRVDRGRSDQTACLQVAVRTLAVGDRNQRVQLVGVSHIGSARYYAGLQEALDAADVVLFEGVGGDRPAFRAATVERSPESSSLQANLARALGLVFQLHHIDYTRDHFINSDLDSRQLLALFQGEDLPEAREQAGAQMEHLLQTMEQATVSGQAGAAVLSYLDTRPGWSRGMRWAMVNILGSVSGDVTGYAGIPDSMRELMEVLIQRRNDVVLADIRHQLGAMPDGATVAVFYGAAHMHDFHRRLVEEDGAKEVAVEWRNAFCGNLERSGLNLLEKRMVTWFVAQQVRTLEIMSRASRAGSSE